jgi:hypothetical protein
VTDNELIDAYHAALGGYEMAKSTDGNRVEAFVQLASAQMALINRFGTRDYLRHYCQRHEIDTPALVASGMAAEPRAASCLQSRMD